MTKRLLRTVPAAILMTTALAWNLPAGAQSTTGGAVPPQPGTTSTMPAPAAGGSTTGGVVPAMPASGPASAARPASGLGPNTSGTAAPVKKP
ncbi:MAG: hypothetical protein QM772_10500 [Ottowia sp.]|uniref:hypothetical protein n=1 Tax=Ottowia sp. TaxID=1898956 RepID=UPI0039E3F874